MLAQTQLSIDDLTSNQERKPTSQDNRCGSCVFFVRFTQNNLSLGECHIAAPTMWPRLESRFGVFPIMNDTNFCGEYTKEGN